MVEVAVATPTSRLSPGGVMRVSGSFVQKIFSEPDEGLFR